MSEEKKPETQVQKDKKHVEDACKELVMENKIANQSKSKIQAYCQGKGFNYLAGQTQSETAVVKPKHAKKRFLRFLDTCAKILSEKYQEITNLKDQFKEQFAYDFQRKVVPHVITNQKKIKILCLDFIKQPQACFMSYTVMSYTFSLAPNILKQTIEKTSSSSSGFKGTIGTVSLGFSNQQSSSYTEEKLVGKERGMTLQDMQMLIMLADVDNTKKQYMLNLFVAGKFNAQIDY